MNIEDSKKNNDDLELFQTKDGTLTLADRLTGEWYHNSAGAYRESLENYAIPACKILKARAGTSNHIEHLKVLDVCFGLGYNTFSLLDYILECGISIGTVSIVAIENDLSLLPGIKKVFEQDCFRRIVEAHFVERDSSQEFGHVFKQAMLTNDKIQGLFLPKSNIDIGQLKFELFMSDLRRVVPEQVAERSNCFDLIFHDPFSPAKFPQFWTKDLFEIYRKLLIDEFGMLFTYSIAVAVRSALIQSGFSVYRTTAVGAKAGGTLAISNMTPVALDSMNSQIPRSVEKVFANLLPPSESELVFALSEEEIERILSSSGIPYRDPQMNLARSEILKAREFEIIEFKNNSAS